MKQLGTVINYGKQVHFWLNMMNNKLKIA